MAHNVKRTTIDQKCIKCNGACWDENQAERQKNAIKMFGVIPNNCVDSEIDGPRCPFKP